MSWWNELIITFRRIIKDIEDDDDDYSSDEVEYDDELTAWIKLHETFINSLFI